MFSSHRISTFRCCWRTKMFVCFSILAIYFNSVKGVNLSNSSQTTDSGNPNNENITFSRSEQLSARHKFLASNSYLHAPLLGFPVYQNLHQLSPAIAYHQNQIQATSSPKNPPPFSLKKHKNTKVKKIHGGNPSLSNEETQTTEKTSMNIMHSKDHQTNESMQQEGNDLDKPESKTEDAGSKRGCPACISGTCDALLDPSTNISGIPVIQILIALAVGAFWAAIFAFLLHNFIEYKDDEGGYGPSPVPEYGAPMQYGAPQPEYGAPTGYSNHRIAYGNGYGKRSQSLNFNNLSNRVFDAIDKFISKYNR